MLYKSSRKQPTAKQAIINWLKFYVISFAIIIALLITYELYQLNNKLPTLLQHFPLDHIRVSLLLALAPMLFLSNHPFKKRPGARELLVKSGLTLTDLEEFTFFYNHLLHRGSGPKSPARIAEIYKTFRAAREQSERILTEKESQRLANSKEYDTWPNVFYEMCILKQPDKPVEQWSQEELDELSDWFVDKMREG
jgi:hypothetical protein